MPKVKHNTLTERKTINTVGDLIKFLQKLDPNAVPISLEPPFTGVRVVLCDGGTVLFGRPPLPKNHPSAMPVGGPAKKLKRRK